MIALVDGGLGVDTCVRGAPILHWAVQFGWFDLASALLLRGAKVMDDTVNVHESPHVMSD